MLGLECHEIIDWIRSRRKKVPQTHSKLAHLWKNIDESIEKDNIKRAKHHPHWTFFNGRKSDRENL